MMMKMMMRLMMMMRMMIMDHDDITHVIGLNVFIYYVKVKHESSGHQGHKGHTGRLCCSEII